LARRRWRAVGTKAIVNQYRG
jgi:bacterioferritin (cytochrome b1)